MSCKDRSEALYKKISSDELELKDDKEFSYALGQLAYYLCRQSNLKNNYYQVGLDAQYGVNRILDAISRLNRAYDYKISSQRYYRLYKLILSYKSDHENARLFRDEYLIGFMSNTENVIYRKSDKLNNDVGGKSNE